MSNGYYSCVISLKKHYILLRSPDRNFDEIIRFFFNVRKIISMAGLFLFIHSLLFFIFYLSSLLFSCTLFYQNSDAFHENAINPLSIFKYSQIIIIMSISVPFNLYNATNIVNTHITRWCRGKF